MNARDTSGRKSSPLHFAAGKAGQEVPGAQYNGHPVKHQEYDWSENGPDISGHGSRSDTSVWTLHLISDRIPNMKKPDIWAISGEKSIFKIFFC